MMYLLGCALNSKLTFFGLGYYYKDFWREYGNPYVLKYYFMHEPWDMLVIVMAYFSFVVWIGPKMMKNRKPFELRKLILFYNVLMVALNAYLFSYGISVVFSIPL